MVASSLGPQRGVGAAGRRAGNRDSRARWHTYDFVSVGGDVRRWFVVGVREHLAAAWHGRRQPGSGGGGGRL